jgi:hypothetical protein
MGDFIKPSGGPEIDFSIIAFPSASITLGMVWRL